MDEIAESKAESKTNIKKNVLTEKPFGLTI